MNYRVNEKWRYYSKVFTFVSLLMILILPFTFKELTGKSNFFGEYQGVLTSIVLVVAAILFILSRVFSIIYKLDLKRKRNVPFNIVNEIIEIVGYVFIFALCIVFAAFFQL